MQARTPRTPRSSGPFQPKSSRLLLPVLRYCEHVGHDLTPLHHALSDRHGGVAATFDPTVDARFWNTVAAIDPTIALLAPTVTLPGDFHNVGLAVVARPSLAEAMEDIVKGASSFAESAVLALDLAGDTYRFSLRTDDSPPLGVDYIASLIVEVCRRLGGPEAAPQHVRLQRPTPEPDRVDAYRQRFGPSVSFGHGETVLVFGRLPFERSLSSASPLVADLCAHLPTDSYLDESGRPMSDAVARHLERALSLSSDDVHLEGVAAALHVSPRTLQRRLAAEGTSLRSLRSDVRLSTALALLESTSLPVAQVAGLVGFDHASRFSAAFAKRFGQTPSATRSARRRLPTD